MHYVVSFIILGVVYCIGLMNGIEIGQLSGTPVIGIRIYLGLINVCGLALVFIWVISIEHNAVSRLEKQNAMKAIWWGIGTTIVLTIAGFAAVDYLPEVRIVADQAAKLLRMDTRVFA